MTGSGAARLAALAIRPDELQYFIFYTAPAFTGWRTVATWSHSGLDYVRGSFLNDYWDERPQILFVVSPGCN